MATRSERPITSPDHDRLERGPFIGRLCDALIDSTGHARGVVVGITGPWGSGKSSLLNLMQAEIELRYPAAVVVRFDPWLVSKRDDLITQFFEEMLARIKEVGTNNPQVGKVATQLAGRLAKYAADLAPASALLGLPIPGLREALKSLGQTFDRTESLSSQRSDLITSLAGVEVPIVVLIDELDRVEDVEVRAVAQLVRAVADFPGLSYLLAYDRERVIHALGGGERGNAYLEKIVQLQVPLPVSLDVEMRELMLTELAALSGEGGLPRDWSKDARFAMLMDVALGNIIETPRDVRRMVGSYTVLAPMVQGEVEWVDLLGYCILLTKAPQFVDQLRRRPDEVVVDPLATRAMNIYLQNRDVSREEKLKSFGVMPTDVIVPILKFLFPHFTGENIIHGEVPEDTIRYRRPLVTVLRLGLLPGGVSRKDVQAFLTLDEVAMTADLRQRIADDRLPSLVDRLHELYHGMEDPDPCRTWRSIGSFLEPIEPRWLTRFDGIPEMSRAFKDVLLRHIKGNSTKLAQHIPAVLEELIARRHYAFATSILRHHFFGYGLYGKSKGENHLCILSPEAVSAYAGRLADAAYKDHARGDLLARLPTVEPLFLMKEVGRWNAECRDWLADALRTDDDALVSFAILSCGGNYLMGHADFEFFAGTEDLFRRFDKVLVAKGEQLDPSAREALKKALDHY